MSDCFGGLRVPRTVTREIYKALYQTNIVQKNSNGDPVVNDQLFNGPLRWVVEFLRHINRAPFMNGDYDLFPVVLKHLLLQFTTISFLKKNCDNFVKNDVHEKLVIFVQKFIDDETISETTVKTILTVLESEALSTTEFGQKLIAVFKTFRPKLKQVIAAVMSSGYKKVFVSLQGIVLKFKSGPLEPIAVYKGDGSGMDIDHHGPIGAYNNFSACANTSLADDFKKFQELNPGLSLDVQRAAYDEFTRRTLPISEDVEQDQKVTTRYFELTGQQFLEKMASEEIQIAGPDSELMQRPVNCHGDTERVAEQTLNHHLNIRLYEFFNEEKGVIQYLIIDGNNSVIAWLRGLDEKNKFMAALAGAKTVWTPAMIGKLYNISCFNCAAMKGPLNKVLEIVDGMKKSEPQPNYAAMNPSKLLILLREHGFCGPEEHPVNHCFLFQTVTWFFHCQVHVAASLERTEIEKLAISSFEELSTIQNQKNDFEVLPEEAQDFVRFAFNALTWTKQQKGMNANQRVHLLLSIVHAVLFFSIGGSGLCTDKIDNRMAQNLLDEAIDTLTDKANIDKNNTDKEKAAKAKEVLENPRKALAKRMFRYIGLYWLSFRRLRTLKNDFPAVCRYAALFAEILQDIEDQGTEMEITVDIIEKMWALIHVPSTVPKNPSGVRADKVEGLHATLIGMKTMRTYCEKAPKNHSARTGRYVESLKLGCKAFRTLLTDHELARVFIPELMVTAPVDDKSSTGEGSDDGKKRKLGNE